MAAERVCPTRTARVWSPVAPVTAGTPEPGPAKQGGVACVAPRFVLTSAFAAVGFTALSAPAQQPQRGVYPPAATSADQATDPGVASRPARYLLRNGQDYLSYREYDRALNFFRAVESRQAELSDNERLLLRQGIARAQQGKREAVNGPHVVAQPKGRPTNPPGSFALARPATTTRTATNRQPMAAEPVQLTSGTVVAANDPPAMESAVAAPAPADAPALASPAGVIPSDPAPLDLPPVVAAAAPTADGLELPSLPTASPAPLPDLATAPSVASAPAALPEATPAVEPPPALEPASPADLPTLGSTAPALDPAPAPALPETVAPASADLPTLPQDPAGASIPTPAPMPETAPAPAPMPETAPAVEPAQDPAAVPAQARTVEPPPAPEASTIPSRSAALGADPDRPTLAQYGTGGVNGSLLSTRDQEEVARLAQRTDDNPASERANAANPTGDPNTAGSPAQGSTRLELQRAPSPTEARPIRRIPVPEEFVPLGRRDWTPNRKYWAAAGTCHMTLYFQDPVLERYGQGVEQALGTRGRYFSYPLDDPKQSNQRNQILQPFWSIGKFCFQVGTLPYKLVVDPPWEAEYDLGYYRPGDKIPTDTIMITPTGVGPPLKGRRY